VWDKIITNKEAANLQLNGESTEYEIQDNGNNLR
jgi:hypothetical protein